MIGIRGNKDAPIEDRKYATSVISKTLMSGNMDFRLDEIAKGYDKS